MGAPVLPHRRMGARRRAEIAAGKAAFAQRTDAERIVLCLPTPISVNDLHAPRAGGGIRRSDAYEAWLTEAGWRLAAQRPGRIAGRYTLDLGLPRESGLDLDNAVKAASDLLQLHGVIRNDRNAERIGLWWQDATAETVIVVEPADAPVTMPYLANGGLA
ncbi:hypothetical protein [Methylobacterium sp. Leaf118]|uniref:hypothetical protein n=1 Tax=Methylobacterium sp. Leaf118 TaxID=2876562 RepID=UPI001E38D504|nr:hypothetical protein [Methylobacterium sp. Leaf118]